MTSRARWGHIFLIGFMGSGKSTVGPLLAKMLSRPFVDLDANVEHSAAKTCAEIFADAGEEAFRSLEAQALMALADAEPAVVACGGGIVLRDENRRLLKKLGTTIYLRVTAGEALARIGNTVGRPLLATGDPQSAATLLRARTGLYRAVADITVDTEGHAPAELASMISRELSLEGGGL